MRSDECRACGSIGKEEVLDMGRMPLAGDFRPLGDPNVLYPLAVDVCTTCGLLQVREQVPISAIFGSGYSYSSSTVPGLVRHFEEYAREAGASGGPSKRLLEIGCNDGVFLGPLARAGFEVVGIDASENVARLAQANGLDVRSGVFGRSSAQELRAQYGPFEIVTCSNVFAHNPQLDDFIDGVKVLLNSPHSEFWVEVQSADRLYGGLQWDCFYHEHCFYWSIHSLSRCLRERGLYLQRYKTVPMHGGALRAVFSGTPAKLTVADRELTVRDWRSFGESCHRSREILKEVFESLPLKYAYGAAGRAVTLINWSGIAPHLTFVIDGSPLRHGKAIPNTSVPIISEAEFARAEPGRWCFVSAHNYLDDIRAKVERSFPDRKVNFVTPLPHVSIQ